MLAVCFRGWLVGQERTPHLLLLLHRLVLNAEGQTSRRRVMVEIEEGRDRQVEFAYTMAGSELALTKHGTLWLGGGAL